VLSYFFRKANLQCYARKLVSVIIFKCSFDKINRETAYLFNCCRIFNWNILESRCDYPISCCWLPYSLKNHVPGRL